MFFCYLALSFIVIYTLNAIKITSFELNKNVILKTFDSNVRVLFREKYIRFDYKQRETCSETFFTTVFLKTLKKKVTLDSSSIYQSLTVIKMKRLYFCFNFWKKSKENIAVLENKKFGKGCLKSSEHILYLIFFPPPNHGERHY